MPQPKQTTEKQIRRWFNQHGWQLPVPELRAALAERGADDDLTCELIDDGANRRRATAKQAPAPRRNGTRPIPEPAGNVPPQNLEAEEHVLGAMMLAQGAIAAVSEIVDATDFYRQSHGLIYQAALNLYGAGEPVDAITLINQLEQQGELEQAGGRVRLHELAAIVPASANAAHYARIVHETATLRGLINAGSRIAQLGWAREGEPAQLVDQAGQLIYDLEQHREKAGAEQIAAGLRAMYDRLATLSEAGSEIVGVPSGFRSLDRLTYGFEPGNLAIIAARPSMGKSALALTIARHLTVTAGLPVAFFSLEMSRLEVSQRLVSQHAHVDGGKLRAPGRTMNTDEWARITNAIATIEQAPLFVSEQRGMTLIELRSQLRRVKQRNPNLAIAIIDYLQLMTPPADTATATRNDQVGAISRGLKHLAGDLDIPIIALAQLNRAVEQRVDKHPQLSDLRDSGEIEQDADLVCFLYRDGYYNKNSATPDVAELVLAKHRNGPTGTAPLSWVSRYSMFTDLGTETM